MKKKYLALLMIGALSLSVVACGKSTEEAQNTSSETEAEAADTGSEAGTENGAEAESAAESEQNNMIGNPWRECTEEEAYQYAPNGFSAPAGAVNERWSTCEAADNTMLPGTMVQLDFELDGMEFTAREQAVAEADSHDISGMYYEWTATDEGKLANWAGGAMPFTSMRYVGDEGYADVILWYDIETGYAYSLSVMAPDLEGFDIQAVAEAIYDPDKQIGANMPDDDEVDLDEDSIEAIREAAEEEAPDIDITGCDTFTQIVDTALSDGMGYAPMDIGDESVLFVSGATYDDLEGHEAAIDSTLFIYKDGAPYEIGKVVSGGTAYPISINDRYIYSGSNHWICKYVIADGKLSIMEKASVTYDTDGNAVYSYESEDGGDYTDMDQAEAESIFDELNEEMFDGEVISFSTVVK